MRHDSALRRALAWLPLLFALLLFAACSAHPAWADFLTGRAYAALWRELGRACARLPVSAGLALAAAFLLFLAVSLLRRRFFRALTALSLAAAWFVGGWGVSCLRTPLRDALSRWDFRGDTQPGDTAESLYALCLSLAATAEENACEAPAELLSAVPAALDALAPRLAEAGVLLPRGEWAAPRASGVGGLLRRLLVEGMFVPFTGEALVNEAMPACCLPFVACHEAAHARGFAREEDANLLASLACAASEEPFFRFSGALCSLSFALEALREADPARYAQACAALPDTVRASLAERAAFWESYRDAPAAVAALRVNESYLSSVGAQHEGLAAYGGFVDALLALSPR